MNPSSIYSQTLSQLDAAEIAMTSVEGDGLIQAASPAAHRDAIRMLLDIHQARLTLGNATLLSIAEQLKANEAPLVAGTAAVKKAISALDNLGQILNAVGNLIAVVAQIVPLV